MKRRLLLVLDLEFGWSGEIISTGLSSAILWQSHWLARVQIAYQSGRETVVQSWLNITVCPPLDYREIISYDYQFERVHGKLLNAREGG